MVGEGRVVRDGVRLATVVEAVPARAGEGGVDGGDERGRSALLGGLPADARGCGGLQGVLLRLAEVALQTGRDPAGVDRVGDDAVVQPPPGQPAGEAGVRGLRLRGGDLRVDRAVLEVQVGDVDACTHVRGGAERDDPCAVPFGGSGAEGIAEPDGEGEVAGVVRGELHLPALGRAPEPAT